MRFIPKHNAFERVVLKWPQTRPTKYERVSNVHDFKHRGSKL